MYFHQKYCNLISFVRHRQDDETICWSLQLFVLKPTLSKIVYVQIRHLIWDSKILLKRQIPLCDILLEFLFRDKAQYFCLQETSPKGPQSKQNMKIKSVSFILKIFLLRSEQQCFCSFYDFFSLSFLNWRILTLEGSPLKMTFYILCVSHVCARLGQV